MDNAPKTIEQMKKKVKEEMSNDNTGYADEND
jgi:hypothetical protein